MGEARRRIAAMADMPYQKVRGGWRLHIEGRRVVTGQSFDPHRGYRVTLGFVDSSHCNVLSPRTASLIAHRLLNRRNPGEAVLSDELIKLAARVTTLNVAWRQSGRPAVQEAVQW